MPLFSNTGNLFRIQIVCSFVQLKEINVFEAQAALTILNWIVIYLQKIRRH